MMVLATLTIELVVDDEGGMQVATTKEGELQYITALGMLEMAKESLSELMEEEE